MNQDPLNRKETLEKYLLGLLSQEQSDAVARQLQNDPELRKQLQTMESKLDEYIGEQGLQKNTTTKKRRLQDFHDLDHEMITAMTRRNHNLVIWRLALSFLCLVLLFTSGYLFRQNQNYRMEVNREKALHAQEEASARRQIEALRGRTTDADDLHTQKVVSEDGEVLVHYLKDDQTAFLDLSHLRLLDSAQVYLMQAGEQIGSADVTILGDSVRQSLLPIPRDLDRVRLYRADSSTLVNPDTSGLRLVTEFKLSYVQRPRSGALSARRVK